MSPKESRVSAIILAAGKSTRMGRNKLLLPWGGTTVIGHICRVIGDARPAELLIVTGHEAEAVEAKAAGARAARNPDYGSGMASSIATGVRAASENAEALLIALGDMPHVTVDLVREILDKASRDRIVVPRKGERLGQPILFGADFRDDLLNLSGDKGARNLILNNPEKVDFLPVQNDLLFEDLDTPEDYDLHA